MSMDGDGNGGSIENSMDDEKADEIARSLERVVAIADYRTQDPTQLSFSEGDQLVIISKESASWWWGELDGSCGYIPVTYIVNDAEYVNQREWQDDEYFDAYSKLKIHLEMLNDRSRTLAYRNAISTYCHLFRGKAVLDVGCGTGILSLFCAKDGQARKVYAVDASENIASVTSEVINLNDLSDTVSVVIGKMEDVELPEKVDIILSEWMGTFLVFEFMIESVLLARDKWLKSGGLIWPSNAKLFLVPCSAQKAYDDSITIWYSQYGFDFSPFLRKAKTELLQKPLHNYDLDLKDCLSNSSVLLDMDMATLSREELELMSGIFEFEVVKDGPLHGFCAWFSVTFGNVPIAEGSSQHVILSTGAEEGTTHWKQNLFLLDEPINVTRGNYIKGSALLQRNPKYRRHLSVFFDFTVFASRHFDGNAQSIKKKFFIWR